MSEMVVVNRCRDCVYCVQSGYNTYSNNTNAGANSFAACFYKCSKLDIDITPDFFCANSLVMSTRYSSSTT